MTVAADPPADLARASGEKSILPVVARPRSGPPTWVLIFVAVGIGLVLFAVLDARRRSLTAPAVSPRAVDAVSLPSPVPPLHIPPEPVLSPPAPVPASPMPSPPVASAASSPTPVHVPVPQTVYVSPPQPAAPAVPSRVATEPALVIDTTGSAPAPTSSGASDLSTLQTGEKSAVAGARTGAGVLANKATTVAQGTLIPAVLETALDSTRPGLARAIVSRDIRGFDGSRVLIPRGSRLIGEYGADAERGQKRMLVNWIRLIRPDGATIAIGSPAADPLGQGGIRARVNSHFFERFAGAILQSALDVGVNLASRAADAPTIVALPGSFEGGTARVSGQSQVRPTLTVRAATSISIFVARDLDFTEVETP